VALPVEQVPEVADWVRLRGFEPEQLDGLARALPTGAQLPDWCRFKGKRWSDSGHQLVVLMHDATGKPEGLHARSVRPDAPKGEKAGAMAGMETRGLVMANDVGRYLLQHTPWVPVDVVVSEGEPDWLTACTAWASKGERACFGIVAGSWSAELASRIPANSRVTVRTHNDKDGDKYAAAILETLGHCRVLRGTRDA